MGWSPGDCLTLGFADAANLGWKLASVIPGERPESLLDTNNAERRPVAEVVLANIRTQAAIIRTDAPSTAMRAIVEKLMEFDDANRLIGEIIAVRYDLGPERDDVGRLIGNRPIRHRDGEESLYDFMQDGKGILLDTGDEGRDSRLVAASTARIRCVAVETGPSMLIRPDACVAWAGEENRTDGLAESLRLWFNPALDSLPIIQ